MIFNLFRDRYLEEREKLDREFKEKFGNIKTIDDLPRHISREDMRIIPISAFNLWMVMIYEEVLRLRDESKK